MKLVKHSVLNNRYFAPGNRPSKKIWRQAVDSNTINGLILSGTVYIDEDDFLSRKNLDKNPTEVATPNYKFIDLLA